MYKKKGSILNFDAISYILVVAILISVGTFGVHEWIENSRRNTAQNELASIASAVSHYHFDTDKYPADDSLSTLTKASNGYGPWISSINKDPWGNDYKIKSTANRFVVYSTGGENNVTLPDLDTPPDKHSGSTLYVIGQ